MSTEPNKFALHLSMKEVEYTGGGNVVAPIFFQIDDAYFPELGWWDFPLALLEWWNRALASQADSITLDFMDGPLLAEIRRKGAICEFQGIKRKASGRELWISAQVDFQVLRNEIRQKGVDLLSKVDRGRVSSDDVAALERALAL